VVCREDQHHVVVGAVQRLRGKRDRGRRVPADGLGQQHPRREVGKLLAHESGVSTIGHDRHVLRTHQVRNDPVPRPLEERAIPDQPQERLRVLRARERPEARASPAGKDDRVQLAPPSVW
jgi:hypothetical protein